MATFSGSPSASAHDAQETAAGSVDINTVSINANDTGARIGIIIDNVTIPQGSTISAATLTVRLVSGTYDDPDLTISGIDADDVANFSTSANDLSGRTLTTANSTWTATGLGSGPATSPSLVSAVQEVIDRAGWASGNQLGLMLVANSDSSNFRINAYDNGSNYAVLDVTYTAPSGGGQPPRTAHQFRQRRTP